MAKNRSFTGGRRSVGTPTLNKEYYHQLIRMIRNLQKQPKIQEAPLTDVRDPKSGANEKNLNNHNTEKETLQMTDKNTQMKKLLKLFQKTPVLSVQYIVEVLKLNSPRKVISDLRMKGVPIKDRYVESVNADGQWIRYKEYWVEPSWFEDESHANLL